MKARFSKVVVLHHSHATLQLRANRVPSYDGDSESVCPPTCSADE